MSEILFERSSSDISAKVLDLFFVGERDRRLEEAAGWWLGIGEVERSLDAGDAGDEDCDLRGLREVEGVEEAESF